MSGKTLARIACEAFWKAAGAGPEGQEPDAAWAWAEKRGTEDAWDAAAQAVIAASEDCDCAAESRQLREQLDDLRTSLDYAAGQWESNAMPHTMPVRDTAERGIYASCARDLRAALKANAPDAADVRAERDEAREQLAGVRERLGNLAAGLELSAGTTEPSKKSDIERQCARRVRDIAGSLRAGLEG